MKPPSATRASPDGGGSGRPKRCRGRRPVRRRCGGRCGDHVARARGGGQPVEPYRDRTVPANGNRRFVTTSAPPWYNAVSRVKLIIQIPCLDEREQLGHTFA